MTFDMTIGHRAGLGRPMTRLQNDVPDRQWLRRYHWELVHVVRAVPLYPLAVGRIEYKRTASSRFSGFRRS